MKWLAAVCVLLLGISNARADSAWNREVLVQSARVDLDGDGRREHIRLRPVKYRLNNRWENSKYRLLVNEQVIWDWGNNTRGFYIANIDRRDRYKEIIVSSSDGSDWASERLFAFMGKRIRRVNREPLSSLTFKGNGFVTTWGWQGFWGSEETYRLNEQHTLTWLPRRFYPVRGALVSPRLLKPMALHQYQQINTLIRMLPAGLPVKITRSDLRDWYEVRAPHGTRGWVTLEELQDHLKVTMAG